MYEQGHLPIFVRVVIPYILDGPAWLAWHERENKPAYARWDAAMDTLDAALGYEVSRHPFNFRPICEEILRG